MALTPGGGRSPSTQPRPSPSPSPSPAPNGRSRPPRSSRRFNWPRSASVSVVRLGVLIAGLVIIADLTTTAFKQRTFSADDVAAVETIDNLVNIVLFSLLGVLVARQTGLMLTGAVAGLLAALLDAIVVTAAELMALPATPLSTIEETFVLSVVLGTLFAGLSGVLYVLAQRSGGRRPR